MDFSINEGTLVVTAGTGESFDSAIVIKRVPRGLSASGAEHVLLAQRFGQDREWSVLRRELVSRGSRSFDVVHVAAADRELHVHFDVTALIESLPQR